MKQFSRAYLYRILFSYLRYNLRASNQRVAFAGWFIKRGLEGCFFVELISNVLTICKFCLAKKVLNEYSFEAKCTDLEGISPLVYQLLCNYGPFYLNEDNFITKLAANRWETFQALFVSCFYARSKAILSDMMCRGAKPKFEVTLYGKV